MMKRFSLPCLAACLLALSLMMPPAQAKRDTTDWYRWYRDLHGYLSSVGGVLCEPGTDLQFHHDGRITATSRDATCLASLDSLNYPLPNTTSVRQLSLPIRRHSNWPLSHRALRELISMQLNSNPLIRLH